jgi:hypothetical protein
MTFAKDDLIAALRMRYDYYSAENVFEAARQKAQVAEKGAFDPGEVRAIRAVLPSVGDRLTSVLARFDELLEAAPAGKGEAAKPAPKAETKPEPAKAEAKPEPKPEPAKAEKAVEKPTEKSGDKKPAAEPIETTVVLSGLAAKDDEQVMICGDGELGDWDPERAVPMKRTGDQWQMTLKVPADSALEFKLLRKSGDGKVTWEDGDNRTLPAKPRHEVTWR